MNKMGKVVVFGAGATARGHVGLLCWQKGYDLVFVEQDAALASLLRNAGRYHVKLYGGNLAANQCQEIEVSGFQVIDSLNREDAAKEIVSADLVLTAVFDQNLLDVARTIAIGVRLSQQSNRKRPLNVIACENMMDSSSTLGRWVEQGLDPDDRAYFTSTFAFPDCMISRVVPRPSPDPLHIVTEDYNEWTVRKDALIGRLPAGMDFIQPVENQTARLERKLFIHNGGHAVCGYTGYHRGCRYIHQAVQDPVVVRFVSGALDELGEVVQRKHGFKENEIETYKADLVKRGSIAALKDDVLRVVRDPIRKLSSRERLVAPALAAEQYGLPREWIVRGIVALLKYAHPSDTQSIELQNKLNLDGLRSTLVQICGIPPGSLLLDEIEQAANNWDALIKE